MKRLMAAVMFLTRLPLPGKWEIGASDVGRSIAFFPLVGLVVGGIQCGLLAAVLWTFRWTSERTGEHHMVPAFVIAVVLTVIGALTTGALHLDGLADMADGFGGGHSKDDVLRIMRDHSIGSFGGVAIALVLALKVASIFSLIEHGAALRFLLVAPVVARAPVAALSAALPYARAAEGGLGSVAEHVGVFEVSFSCVTAFVIAIGVLGWRGGVVLAVAIAASLWNARLCIRKIQGMTGDTLGANIEICEALILTAGALLTS